MENPHPVAEVLHTGKCSGILMSFSDAGEALRDAPQAWEWSSPKAAFTQGHRAGLHRAELSADSRSLPDPALRPPTAEYTLMLLRRPSVLLYSLLMSFDFPKESQNLRGYF